MNLTTSEGQLIRELIRRAHINAKREKEAIGLTTTLGAQKVHIPDMWFEWNGQEIMAKQLLDILEN